MGAHTEGGWGKGSRWKLQRLVERGRKMLILFVQTLLITTFGVKTGAGELQSHVFAMPHSLSLSLFPTQPFLVLFLTKWKQARTVFTSFFPSSSRTFPEHWVLIFGHVATQKGTGRRARTLNLRRNFIFLSQRTFPPVIYIYMSRKMNG